MRKSIVLFCVVLCGLESSGNPVSLKTSLNEQNGTVTKLTASMSSPAPPQCAAVAGYRYSSVTNSCYKFHNDYVTWPVANTICNLEEAHLAVVSSLEEVDASRMEVDAMGSNWVWMGLGVKVGIDHLVWIGVYRDLTGRWRTVTGEDVVSSEGYPMWGGVPWNAGNSRYAVLGKKGYIYNEATNSKGFPFICERAP